MGVVQQRGHQKQGIGSVAIHPIGVSGSCDPIKRWSLLLSLYNQGEKTLMQIFISFSQDYFIYAAV